MKSRKVHLLVMLAIFSLSLMAQERRQSQYTSSTRGYSASQSDTMRWKGSYLTVSISGGIHGLDYSLNSLGEKGKTTNKLGGAVSFSYSYFFNNHWGFTTGLSASRYVSNGKLNGWLNSDGTLMDDKFYGMGMLVDDDYQGRPVDFELRARISNLEERQTTYFLDVPVMLMYQTHFGEKENWGLYGGLGVKLQFPFNTRYKIQGGENSQFNVSGKYDGVPTDMGAPSNPPVPQHGYGTITNPNATLDWNGKGKHKMGVAGSAELGFLFVLKEDLDLLVGGYIDYGLTNVKKGPEKSLFTAPGVYHPAANNQIGKGIEYNGMLQSDVTGKIKPIAFGLKIGLRFQTSSH